MFSISAKASPGVIYVPSNYARIQWAVGNASVGDTIIVNSGIYYEQVIIDKSLTLIGENGNTIIDGNSTCHVVTVIADNVNISGFTIQNSGPNFGESGIRLLNSRWCNVSYNVLIQNGHGIWIGYSSDSNIIAWNNVSHNLVGFGLRDSSNNIITNNYIHSNTLCGIGLSNASNNILTSNIAKSNEYGIWLSYCTNFTVAGNTLADNWGGIYLNNSDSNTIFHNNIINNTCQLEIINSTSTWDSDFEGNYWSEYNGTDADQDGIGDNAYMIDANNTDDYPLMGTFSDFTIEWEEQIHHVTTICNSTISDFQFNGTAILFNVTGEDETAGFCRIRIPTTLINNAFTVYVDGVNTTYTLLPRSNATYSYLYFTYNHSTKEVIIIPEFPLTLLLYLLMTLTLAATAYSKKKKKMLSELHALRTEHRL
jgi:parallel beta-helix repeat protein